MSRKRALFRAEKETPSCVRTRASGITNPPRAKPPSARAHLLLRAHDAGLRASLCVWAAALRPIFSFLIHRPVNPGIRFESRRARAMSDEIKREMHGDGVPARADWADHVASSMTADEQSLRTVVMLCGSEGALVPDRVVHSLCHVFESQRALHQLLRYLLWLECCIRRPNTTTLFRDNSLVTKVVTAAGRTAAAAVLTRTTAIAQAMAQASDRIDFEVDSARLGDDKTRDAQSNAISLRIWAQKCLEALIKSPPAAPLQRWLRLLFHAVSRSRVPEDQRHSFVSSYLFCRIICPDLLICRAAGPPRHRRNIVLLCKILQKTANGVSLCRPENQHEELNEWAEGATTALKSYIHTLVRPPKLPPPPPPPPPPRQDARQPQTRHKKTSLPPPSPQRERRPRHRRARHRYHARSCSETRLSASMSLEDWWRNNNDVVKFKGRRGPPPPPPRRRRHDRGSHQTDSPRNTPSSPVPPDLTRTQALADGQWSVRHGSTSMRKTRDEDGKARRTSQLAMPRPPPSVRREIKKVAQYIRTVVEGRDIDQTLKVGKAASEIGSSMGGGSNACFGLFLCKKPH